MKAGGLNAVQTYVMWNFHTQKEGVYDFTGDRDIQHFLQLANDTGLQVILRAGPYSCAEWEFGGFPWFLRQNSDVILRSSDPTYLSYVDAWMDELLPKLEPYLYNNGGPIITVQFENEYGSYSICDTAYLQHLVHKFREHLGPDVVLFTTDGYSAVYLECGALKSELVTVDFGPGGDPAKEFEDKEKFQPYAPLVNSEFYTGWLNQWGYPFTYVSADSVTETLDQILALNASVNFYMYVGGTNFAYWSGSVPGDDADVYDITSYDYDSPISESGDTTWKYFAIKETVSKYLPTPVESVPANSTKTSLKGIKLDSKGTLLIYFDFIASEDDYQSAKYPKSMEELGFDYGFVMYRYELKKDYPKNVTLAFPVNGIGDRVLIQTAMSHNHSAASYLATLDNDHKEAKSLDIEVGLQKGHFIVLFVENRGRLNGGKQMQTQQKGILGNITLDGEILEDWDMIHLKMEGLGSQILPPPDVPPSVAPVPIVYQAEVEMDIEDTFLNFTSFSRGVALVDNFNLGRYWPSKGPQQTLYVPKGIRNSTKFILTLVEFEERSEAETVDFLDYPVLNVLPN
ncbi:beta-galactosidase-like [Symsagittifera roscoffensis]|uniref:beta-galactosidase-like n=1 Tax=Symsagittifera roscoffensis TaxID=84072 RepID=UPI00307C8E94